MRKGCGSTELGFCSFVLGTYPLVITVVLVELPIYIYIYICVYMYIICLYMCVCMYIWAIPPKLPPVSENTVFALFANVIKQFNMYSYMNHHSR